MALLDKLNIVDYIVFGSELGSLDCLKEIAEVLTYEPYYYKQELKKVSKYGIFFPVSRSRALEDYFNKYRIKQIHPQK